MAQNPQKRARETTAHILGTATGPEGCAKAVIKTLTEEMKARGVEQFSEGKFFIYSLEDLKPIKRLPPLWWEAGQSADEKIAKGELQKDKKVIFRLIIT